MKTRSDPPEIPAGGGCSWVAVLVSLGLVPAAPPLSLFMSRINCCSAERDQAAESKTKMIMMEIYGQQCTGACC